jgi:3-oxoacyl-[acyl-carrier protein] reductase
MSLIGDPPPPSATMGSTAAPPRILAGRVALVTGASRGIGAQVALRLARSGAKVIINYPDETQRAAAQQTLAAIAEEEGHACIVQADVSDPVQVAGLFEQSIAYGAGLDIVVLNAGGDAVVRPVADTTEEEFDRVMALNARGQFVALQLAARHLRSGGRIVFVSSSTATQPYPGTASYAGAKIASEAYVRALSREVAARNVTANVVSPGMTATETMLSQTTEARRATVINATPLGRIAEPADIADVVHFVVTPAARHLNGQVVHVNGGLL